MARGASVIVDCIDMRAGSSVTMLVRPYAAIAKVCWHKVTPRRHFFIDNSPEFREIQLYLTLFLLAICTVITKEFFRVGCLDVHHLNGLEGGLASGPAASITGGCPDASRVVVHQLDFQDIWY